MHQKTLLVKSELEMFLPIYPLTFYVYSSEAQNPIVAENGYPGVPATVWDIPTIDAGDLSIQGFATDISVNKGGIIDFKITVTSGIRIKHSIYRIGYYQRNGARLIADLGTFTGIAQPGCNVDNTRPYGLR